MARGMDNWRFVYMGNVSCNYVTDLLPRGVRASCSQCDWHWEDEHASPNEGDAQLNAHYEAAHGAQANG